MPTNTTFPYKRTYKTPLPRREVFDPWNSASTGHQRADNRLAGSVSWRDSRTFKLNAQFGSGEAEGGGERLSDLVGAGSADYGKDGRTDTGWDESVLGWRGREGIGGLGWGDVGEMMRSGGHGLRKRKRVMSEDDGDTDSKGLPPPSAQQPKGHGSEDEDEDASGVVKDHTTVASSLSSRNKTEFTQTQTRSQRILNSPFTSTSTSTSAGPSPSSIKDSNRNEKTISPPQIFHSLTIQINGSTYPTISDHKLKYLLTTHGARLSISHARRQVTHVIVGRACSTATSDSPSNDPSIPTLAAPLLSAGGGLASSKLEREILKRPTGSGASSSGTGALGKGTKYVTAEWVVESVKAGVRLPEGRFEGFSIRPRGVRSLREVFGVERREAEGEV